MRSVSCWTTRWKHLVPACSQGAFNSEGKEAHDSSTVWYREHEVLLEQKGQTPTPDCGVGAKEGPESSSIGTSQQIQYLQWIIIYLRVSREKQTHSTQIAANAKTRELTDKVTGLRSYIRSSVWLMLSMLGEWEEVKLKRDTGTGSWKTSDVQQEVQTLSWSSQGATKYYHQGN